jgi:hypothetical protein
VEWYSFDRIDVLEASVDIDGFESACSHVCFPYSFDLLHAILYAEYIECSEEVIK